MGLRFGLPNSIAIVLAIALFGAFPGPSRAQDENIVAVVNASNPVQHLSIHDLRLIYGLYKRTWQGGIRVHVILPTEDGPAMAFLAGRLLRMSFSADVERFYLQAVLRQRIAARPPQLSQRDALDHVRTDLGAIALVDRRRLGEPAGVRILSIEPE